MHAIKPQFVFLLTIAISALLGGCKPQATAELEQPVEMAGPPPAIEGDHGHDGEHEGPHGGHVIELGRSHEFHAEIVEDDQARTVTIYILGPEMQELAIEQNEINLSLLVDGKHQSFLLRAVDPIDGKASQFQSTGSEVFAARHEHEATGKLLVMINGKSYSGAVKHHKHGHNGEEHGHDH